MSIDIRTLIAILAITHLIQVLVFWQQYRINRAYPGPGWWLLWCLAESIGFFSFLLRDIPGFTPAAIIVQNTMLLLGVVFLYIGVRRFLGTKENTRAVIAAYAGWLAAFLYFLFIDNNIDVRSLLISGGVAVVCFITAAFLLNHRPPHLTLTVNVLAAAFIAYGAALVWRFPVTVTDGVMVDIFAPTTINVVTYLSALLSGLLWTFGLIMMLNQQLDADTTEAKHRFEQIFSITPDGVMITRLEDGLIIAANRGFETLTGFAREDAIGKSTLAINIWKQPADRDRVVAELRATGASSNFEAEFLGKDGRIVVGLMSSKVLDLGGVLHILSVTRDITGRKRAEERMAQQLKELQQTHNAMLDREDRVQELKDEVNALLAKQGLPHKYGG